MRGINTYNFFLNQSIFEKVETGRGATFWVFHQDNHASFSQTLTLIVKREKFIEMNTCIRLI